MILDVGHKRRRRHAVGSRPARLRLPRVTLSLKQVAVLGGRNQFLRRAVMIRVVGFAPPGHRDDRAVMKIVVPHRIETVATGINGPNEAYGLRLAFGDQNDWLAARSRARAASDVGNHVALRSVVDRLRCVEA